MPFDVKLVRNGNLPSVSQSLLFNVDGRTPDAQNQRLPRSGHHSISHPNLKLDGESHLPSFLSFLFGILPVQRPCDRIESNPSRSSTWIPSGPRSLLPPRPPTHHGNLTLAWRRGGIEGLSPLPHPLPSSPPEFQ